MNELILDKNSRTRPTAHERIDAILADEDIFKALPRTIGKVVLMDKFDPEQEPTEAEVAIREGYNSNSSVTFIYLADLMRTAINKKAAEDYLRRLLNKTSLPLQHARLRYDIDPDTIELFEETPRALESEAAG